MNRICQSILLFLSVLINGCSDNNSSYQGYVEGYFAYIASQYSGVLKELPVERGQQVKAGQTLFVLEQQPESDQLLQAKAEYEQSEADLTLAEITFKRQKALVKSHAASQESLDKAIKNLAQAKAELAKANANLQQSQWNTAQKTIQAKNIAAVFDTYYLPGEFVPAGHPVVSLLEPDELRIVFYIPESELSQFKINQPIKISCDHCQKNLTAKVDFISPQAEYTPPVIYSNERRDKLVYRVEAAPASSDANTLHPGQPVQVSLLHD